MNVAPSTFIEKWNQKKSLTVWFPTYLLYLPGNLKSCWERPRPTTQHNTTQHNNVLQWQHNQASNMPFWQICQSRHLSHNNEIYCIKQMNHRYIGLYSQTESSLLTTRQYSQTVCRNKMVAAYMRPVFSTMSSPTSSSELYFVIFFNFWCSSEILVQWSLLLLQHQWKTK